ncbi:hypothetical protein LSG25_02335 [Paralcaligenes sp. KSB-10]|uniref:hypothetical protein n=1 Tax=Paralcaligenes sp. KSB-10 TaxID=2901142 RepID=UPI001E58F604|nr:hypothetical protein [Paralcaligenes sp. KSB-10]UHL64766.1 hypothetical protein LSG25_02335 [Paralcaligenes sp. KSB-10]
MKGIIEFMRKVGRLFVDDGSLAIALIAWCVAAGLVLRVFAAQSPWSAPLFFLGCLVILLSNIMQTVKRHK